MDRLHNSSVAITLATSLLFCALTADAMTAPANPPPQAAAGQTALPECNGWGGKPVARTELFFGMALPDGSMVSGDEFQRFVDQEVAPRFPSGLTLLGGNGQFRDARGATIKEHSKLLILLYPYDRANSRKIEAIRDAYVQTFQQESVLRVDGSSCVSF